MAIAAEIGPRPPGSPGNQRATAYVARVLADAGLRVEHAPFTSTWWEPGSARIRADGTWVEVDPAPFSRPCRIRGRVTRRATDADLAADGMRGAVVVLEGDLAAEPYFPKAFPFLDIPEQRARLARLEAVHPAVVILIPRSIGPMAPMEDGDLVFPYLVVPPAVGELLTDGREVEVEIGGTLRRGSGSTPSGHTTVPGSRWLVCAHLDSKITTPGAIDNGGGLATLLAIAGSARLRGLPLEFVAFNGEDHYAAPGEQAWLAGADLSSIAGVLNLDGPGARGRPVTVATLACSDANDTELDRLLGRYPDMERTQPWYESDHTMFAMRGIPSIALTSADTASLGGLLHGPADTVDGVDPKLLAQAAEFVIEWLATRP